MYNLMMATKGRNM